MVSAVALKATVAKESGMPCVCLKVEGGIGGGAGGRKVKAEGASAVHGVLASATCDRWHARCSYYDCC